ncbi:hypothetical protein BDZ45DRAFT_708120 [Acephala macrosclerotiorum]|nr:hypothetical protein BDZ45DRAFT_708120 [Acephala macrosclerotiorum]
MNSLFSLVLFPFKSDSESPFHNLLLKTQSAKTQSSRKELRWFKEYFESKSNINYLFTRKKSFSFFRGEQLEIGSIAPNFIIPSDQKSKEVKSISYQSPQYRILFETKNSFMRKSNLSIANIISKDSLFQNNFFNETELHSPKINLKKSSRLLCGAATLNIANRQNTYSITIAVKSVIKLFRLTIKIYGYYPVIDGNKTTFYRYSIYKFNFTALNGKEKWTVYKFTKNVYDK